MQGARVGAAVRAVPESLGGGACRMRWHAQSRCGNDHTCLRDESPACCHSTFDMSSECRAPTMACLEMPNQLSEICAAQKGPSASDA